MPYESPEAAYEGFFYHFNREDSTGWATVMSYPHTRVSSQGRRTWFETPEDYAQINPWPVFKEAGWVRTEGVTSERIQESDDKVHLAGGWSRINADNEPYISNRVTYVLTRLPAGWGIQARFGTDSFEPGEDTTASEGAALEVVGQHLDAWDARDLDGCAALARYPLTDVGVGAVERYEDAAGYTAALAAQNWSPTTSREANAYQVGRTGANVAVTATLEDGRREQAVFLVADGDDGWRIVARSRIAG